MTYQPTYYEILGLPETLHDEPSISAQVLKSAYRRALLQNHPDKSQLSTKFTLTSNQTAYSVDQISEAFSSLSNPKTRAAYDKELSIRNATTKVLRDKGRGLFRTGVEVVDLDDMSFDESQGIWFRGCRCGDEKGFLIREKNLEEAADDGELAVGCQGCSLWLKVVFGVMEDGAQHAVGEMAGAKDHDA